MSLLNTEIPDLPAALADLLRQIPACHFTTYGSLATALGDVAAARWVGEYMLKHDHDDDCPCHRVVRKGGEIGLYITGDSSEKAARLEAEGIALRDSRVVDTSDAFQSFDSAAPLELLRGQQMQLPKFVEIHPLEHKVRTVAGIDVSYITPQLGVAAYVRIHAELHEVVWSTTVTAPVRFPYIPNYLTFREQPLYSQLFEKVRREGQEASITLVDGNGILHPRRAGSASACGVAVETPTIGVGKKLLCGSVDLSSLPTREPRDVVHQGETIGAAIKAGDRNRPFFISPGHRIDLKDAIRVVLQTLGTGRLPIPIALADRLSRGEATRVKANLASG